MESDSFFSCLAELSEMINRFSLYANMLFLTILTGTGTAFYRFTTNVRLRSKLGSDIAEHIRLQKQGKSTRITLTRELIKRWTLLGGSRKEIIEFLNEQNRSLTGAFN